MGEQASKRVSSVERGSEASCAEQANERMSDVSKQASGRILTFGFMAVLDHGTKENTKKKKRAAKEYLEMKCRLEGRRLSDSESMEIG